MKRLMMLVVAGILTMPTAAYATTCGGNWGAVLATYRGQPAYSNGPDATCADSRTSTYGILYQCVEYTERFYGEVMHFTSAPWTGNGDDYYGSADAKGLRQFVQGGTERPKENDILCFSGGGNGHVAIITSVSATAVTIIDQNRTALDSQDPTTLAMSTSSGHYTVASIGSSYAVQGWLRGYSSLYDHQSPGPVTLAPGQVFEFKVYYKNTGATGAPHWKSDGGVHSIELRSCDSQGNATSSFLQPASGHPTWLDPTNRLRVVTMSEPDVARNGIATFDFWARIPDNASPGLHQVYFRPFHNSGQWIEEWNGMYFPITVSSAPPPDVTPPSDPTSLTVNPTGCNQTNSFTFNWTASTDAGGSGLAGYEWNINGGTPTPEPSTSKTITAPYVGNHTFNVRAYDNAGNRSNYSSVGFCYQPPTGPCPGREISHSPCRQPGDPCLYPTANLQTLPDQSASQWQAVGQAVQGMLHPGKTYSIGFEYRSAASSEIKLGLGTLNPASSDLGLVVSRSTLPVSTNDWKTYWSAPFSASAEQLKELSCLRLMRSKQSTDSFEIRAVRILTVQ